MLFSTEKEEQSLALPITRKHRETAEKFISRIGNEKKRERVYFNTLAVLLVNDYLQLMEIPTDLTAGDSWNPVMRFCEDVADLRVTGLGTLECRYVKVNQEKCHITELLDERIGYVVVQIDDSKRSGNLLGFVEEIAATSEFYSEFELNLNTLQPLSALLEHIHELKKTPFEWSIWKWVENGIDEMSELAKQIGWSLIDLEANFAGAEQKGPDEEKAPKSFPVRRLKIAGKNYELKIMFSPKKNSNNTWKFQLRNSTPGGSIPAGFKLRLLTEAGQPFEGNEAKVEPIKNELYIYVNLESGEGLIWEIEPIPEGYKPEILRF